MQRAKYKIFLLDPAFLQFYIIGEQTFLFCFCNVGTSGASWKGFRPLCGHGAWSVLVLLLASQCKHGTPLNTRWQNLRMVPVWNYMNHNVSAWCLSPYMAVTSGMFLLCDPVFKWCPNGHFSVPVRVQGLRSQICSQLFFYRSRWIKQMRQFTFFHFFELTNSCSKT